MSNTVATPLEMFYRWERETPQKVFLRQPLAQVWRDYTWAEIGDQVRRVAAFLQSLGYAPGSRIALWSSNSKDWFVADLAIMMAGHVSVPIYPGQDIESARYILGHSEAQLIFLGAFDQAARADEAIGAGVRRVGLLGCSIGVEQTLDALLAQHAPMAGQPLPDPESMWTLVYTSGTTGNPKGVIHAHSTPGYVCPDLAQGFRFRPGEERFFSYLPLSHIAERILVEQASIYNNGTVSFSEGLTTFAEELRSVQPTFFFSVPRLWIKFKQAVDAKIPPAAQAHLSAEQKAGIARMLGLAEARMIVTGSAPCPRDVQQWYIDLGILLRDGYGMTENCIHGIGWVHNDHPVAGCIGRPFTSNIEVKLSGEDEILFRSAGLMKGYYKEPEKTAEALRDGWYHSGDTGRYDEDGNLWITGRLSETFKTTKGKFVRPIALENAFGRSELLAQFCAFGHGLDQPVIAVTLSEIGRGLSRDELVRRLGALLESVNAELPPWENLALIYVCGSEWTIDNGLLTPTMKIKRKQIEQAFRHRIEPHLAAGGVVFE
jgi:long-chain acyl-CoA synthetase